MNIKIYRPEDCSELQLEEFLALVVSGNQISNTGLFQRIKGACLLGFYSLDKEIIGVAAIKNVNKKYKGNCFEKANALEFVEFYEHEIGYVYTKEAHRGMGISQSLIISLLNKHGFKSFYATTKNNVMRHLLEKIGFEKLGINYKNENKEDLTLYCYNKNTNKY